MAAAPGPAVRVAVGGRYDALIHSLWTVHPELRGIPAPGGVGLSLNVEKMAALLSRKPGANPRGNGGGQSVVGLRTSQAEVLVCSRGGGSKMVQQRVELARVLRQEGLKCELLPLTSPSVEDQISAARLKGIKWLVYLDPDSLSSGNKVRVLGLVARRWSLDRNGSFFRFL